MFWLISLYSIPIPIECRHLSDCKIDLHQTKCATYIAYTSQKSVLYMGNAFDVAGLPVLCGGALQQGCIHVALVEHI